MGLQDELHSEISQKGVCDMWEKWVSGCLGAKTN